MKYKTGDILVDKETGGECKVLGVCDNALFISETLCVWTEKSVDERFTLKPSEWKPVYGEGYYLVGDNGVVICSNVIDDFRDKFRLATKNCFRTREEAEARLSEIKKEAGLI